ncbi:hydroxysqualene dehydroxylase [Sorangium sp. So ce1335]|uniref:hydroxysqualene dehydroxylase n=1 Tax=Sorangium sp. So ce1335 TaxID=3133335 RepID=UPI003F61554A
MALTHRCDVRVLEEEWSLRMTRVRIFGGGIAGLTVAHELACRDGFEVVVHEPRADLGGKARSQFKDGLPGEHGFRFFPGWYLHVTDIMRRIPRDTASATRAGALGGYPEAQSVASRLREVRSTLTFRRGRTPDSFLQIPRRIGELGEFLQGFEWIIEGLSPADRLQALKRVGLKLFTFYSTPPWLRAERFDRCSLAEFLGADSMPEKVRESLRTVPKALVAMDAYEGSAHTFLNTSLLNMAPAWRADLPRDRILRGPTSRTWIDPWVRSLRALGVQFEHGDAGHAERVIVDGGRVAGVETRSGARVEADVFVLALPVGPLQDVARASGLSAHGAEFDALAALDLTKQTSEMVGLQLYLDRPLTTQPGHLYFADSQYGMTAISQLEVWDDEFCAPLRARGVHGLLSIDITEWRSDPLGRTPPPFKLPIDVSSADELRALVVEQLRGYQLASGAPLLRPESVVAHHLDEDIDLASELNRSALLVHPPGTWRRRPLARTAIENLFLASDFVKNPADLATMEGACSAGKSAARAILAAHARGGPPVVVHELVEELEPAWMRAQQKGFEALVAVLGSFERAERAVDLLLDAGDQTFDALRGLLAAPDELERCFRVGGLVRLPEVSVLGQLRHGLGKLATEAARRLVPSHFATPERDRDRVARRLARVSAALRMLP